MTVTAYDENKICSIALSRIGGGTIDSILEPQTDLEATCANLYFLRMESLLSYEWNWANAEAVLAKDLDVTPLKDYGNAFRLPGDLLSGPYAVEGDGSRINTGNWRIFGAHLYADYRTVIINYRRKPVVQIWPSYFVNLAVTALSSDFSVPVRESVTMKDALYAEAFGTPQENGMGGLFKTARRLDAQSKPTRSIFRNGDQLTATRR